MIRRDKPDDAATGLGDLPSLIRLAIPHGVTQLDWR
jgi:hypothetical protein